MPTEETFIRLIQKTLGHRAWRIGDDCAVLPYSKSRFLVVTTDMLVQGVDFDLGYCSIADVGYKSAMVNLSDIAAMGARPLWLLISLGFPRNTKPEKVRQFYAGVRVALERTKARVVGGDLSKADKRVISVTAVGEVNKKHAKLRSGAKPGNIICVAGNLGWSAAGLALLQHQKKTGARIPEKYRPFVQAHIRPKALLRAGEALGKIKGVSAMMDVSDGLSIDLARLCKASNCGAIVHHARLPMPDILRQAAQSLGADPYHWALHGGEDFALLFACTSESLKSVKRLENKLKISITEIGGIIRETQNAVKMVKGNNEQVLSPKGYDHFRL